MDLPYQIEGLPEAYPVRNADGTITQERQPCYNLMADGFYGDTLFYEGDIVTTHMVPNGTMQPLNAAGGAALMRWLESQPLDWRNHISIEDLTEAATILRADEDTLKLSHENYAKAVSKFALQLKAKRELGEKYIPPIAEQSPIRTAKGKAPPMPNVHFTDPAVRSPGYTGQPQTLHAPQPKAGPVRRTTAAPEALPPR